MFPRKRSLIVLVAVMVMAMTACTQNLNLNIKPIDQMTPKEKSLAAMRIYNQQVDSYKAKLAMPNLSAAEKKVLSVEYKAFQTTWPIIKAYDDFVQGITPTVDDAIILQINQFLAMYRY